MKENFSPISEPTPEIPTTAEKSPRERVMSIIEKWGKKAGLFSLVLNAAFLAGCDEKERRVFVKFSIPISSETTDDTSKKTPPELLHDEDDTHEHKKHSIEFNDVERICPKLSAEDIQHLCNECLPQNIRFRSLSYVDKIEMPLPAYNIKGGYTIAKTTPRGEVTFFRQKSQRDQENINLFLYFFFHESGHLLEFSMNEADRRELDHILSRRITESDRFNSRYVESINNIDKKIENYLKIKEYIAEIISAHLRGQPLSDKDTEIAQWTIQKIDPTFDVNHARNVIEKLKREKGGDHSTPVPQKHHATPLEPESTPTHLGPSHKHIQPKHTETQWHPVQPTRRIIILRRPAQVLPQQQHYRIRPRR